MLEMIAVRAAIDVEIDQLEEEINELLRNYGIAEQMDICTGVPQIGASDHERLCRLKCARLIKVKEQLRAVGG